MARCVCYLLGVVGVSNQIDIKPRAKWADMKKEIEGALQRDASLEARRIAVATNEGIVALTGSVDSWSERDAAVSAAWSAPEVVSVRDEISVFP